MKKTKELPVAPCGLFRKDLVASGRTPIKGSAAKKFRALITEQLFKHVPDQDWAAIFPQKFAVHTEKLTGALLTAAEVKPLLYWIKDESAESASKNDIGLPMFVDLSGGHSDSHMFYPTIYALARIPHLLRPLDVHAPVSKFAVQGADIMWPGVIVPPGAEDGVGRFQEGEKRAVRARGNPVPFAVGWLAQDSASVLAAGGKGKIVNVVHVFGDALWNLGSRAPPNIGFTPKQVYGIRVVGGAEAEAEESDEEDEGTEAQPPPEVSALDASLNALLLGRAPESTAAPAVSAYSWDSEAPFSAAPAAEPVPAAEIAPAPDTAPAVATSSVDSASAVTPAAAPDSDDESASVDDDNDDRPDEAEGDTGDAAANGNDEDAGSAYEGDEEALSTLSPEEHAAVKAMNTAAMDAALLRCFLFAVQTRISDSDLPMSPSTLLSQMELCNVDTTEPRLDIKKSSYRKLAKFLKQLGKLGLAKSKTGGGKQGMCSCELMVMSVSRDSPLMKDAPVTSAFMDAMKKKQKAMEKSHAKQAAAAAAAASAPSSSSAPPMANAMSSPANGPLQVLHRYRMDSALQKLFSTPASAPASAAASASAASAASAAAAPSPAASAEQPDLNGLFAMKDLKSLLWQYTASRGLDKPNGRVRLDSALHAAFVREWNERVNEVTKADLSAAFDHHVTEFHALAFGSTAQIDAALAAPSVDEGGLQFRRGPAPPIEVALDTRDGKTKKVTRIWGLEAYGVVPALFMKEAQKAFACSGSLVTVPANNKHKAYEEVIVQGNVMTDVGAVLQRLYGIPATVVKQKVDKHKKK